MKQIIYILATLWWVLLPASAQCVLDAEKYLEQGEDFYDANDFKNSYHSYKKALEVLEECDATNLKLYYIILVNLAELADEENDYYSAIRYMKRAMNVDNDTIRIWIAGNHGAVSPHRKLSDYYAKAGIWDKALYLKRKRIEDTLKEYEKKEDYESESEFYIVFADYMHWIKNAKYYKDAFRTIKKIQEQFNLSPDWWLGECYYHLYDYDKAIECFKKANNKTGVAKVLAAKGRIAEALATQKAYVDSVKEHRKRYTTLYLSGHDPFKEDLSTLASYYNLAGQYDEAINCEQQNQESVVSYLNIAKAYIGKQDYNTAKKYALKAYQKHPQEMLRILLLAELAKCSFMTNNIHQIQGEISELIQVIRDELLSSFQELTYDERSRYIEEYSDMLNRQIPMYAYYTHSDSIIEAGYNASLMMKGALLNSENSIKRVIEESQDTSLKNLWEEMKVDRYILTKNLEKDSLYRKIDADSLQEVIYRLEDSLVVKCKEYGDITRSMKLKWNDVQQHLHPDEVVIEFLNFPINKDSVMYVALVLREDSQTPKMIPLFEEKQLNGFPDSIHYQCREMTDLIWKPLQSALEGIKSIYFSPSGRLYNIGIEYLPGMENYNIIRLSSTRELVTEEETRTGNRAVLYGGLDYYAKLDTLSKDKSITTLNETFIRGLDIRGGKSKLPHTREEVEDISNELRKANWTCLVDSASMGTEESFKALSGKKISTLHIATHGFYYTPEKADNKRYKFLQLDNRFASAEDKALTRSGLIMSGANHILEREELPDNVEDGILTAKEIADVDLRGLDLVVLSACQTGLGDISQGEGVFGLQRGFKKAGAKSILMSLWKVDDKATKILMTQFYKNWLSGQSKRQALLSAQKYLREVEGEKYNHPKYWAAFILLDGIDIAI